MNTKMRMVRGVARLATNKYLWLLIGLALLFFLIIKPAYWQDTGQRDNRPPTVIRMTDVQRLSLGTYHLAWIQAEDDASPAQAIHYDVGAVPSGFCVVPAPAYSTVGSTELVVDLPEDLVEGPVVGFAVRSVDDQDASYGYGPCRWSLRSPQRVALDVPGRSVRLDAASETGLADCRSDGQGSIWCAGHGEIAHLDGSRWSVFPLPPSLTVDDWLPIDNYDAVVQSRTVQLHLNRAAGNHAFILSPDNEPFDGWGGALRTGRESAFLVTRGLAAEFSAGHVDLAGPPMALNLPHGCQRIDQLGTEGELVFALCRSVDSNLLFGGRLHQRQVRWQDPFPVEGHRVSGIIGSESAGMAALQTADGVGLLRWENGEPTWEPLEWMEGSGDPFIALGGPIERPLAIAGLGSRLWAHVHGQWDPVAGDQEEIVWAGQAVPRRSRFVGTSRGVYAVSAQRTVRLEPDSAERILEHPRDGLGVRGQDSRHYFVPLPVPHAVFSSRDGWEWYEHPLEGPEISVTSLATTPSGGIYLSGWSDSGAPPTGRRALILKLGQEEHELTPALPLPGSPTSPPLIAVDDQGRIYALADGYVTWKHADSESWAMPYALGGEASRALGLASGILVTGRQEGSIALWRCLENDCFRLPVPDVLRGPPSGAFALGDGFCLGVPSYGLWCRDPDERRIPVAFSPEAAARHGLTPQQPWAVLDGRPLPQGSWLVAIGVGESGYLAEVEPGREARLLAQEFRWSRGEVLVRTADGVVYGLEAEGPFEMRLREERFSVPGMLY